MIGLKTILTTAITTLVVVVIAAIAFAYSGVYPVAAGSSHIAPIGWLLEITRKRSVAVRASDLVVPEDIDSPQRITAGAGHYKEMCARCHGAPGVEPAQSFNPIPPALYRHRVEPHEAFWTIKHGLRMTAMPSHLDHSDTDNWDTVAFVRALPDMSPAEYNLMTEEATHSHADGQEHDHGNQHQPEPSSENDHSATDHDHGHAASTPEDAIDSFHHALVEGRAEDALAYLHPQATVIEGGQIESVSHYADGHMKSDMRFLGQISIEPISREVVVDSDTQTTIVTRRRMHGQLEQRSLDIVSVETATLIKRKAGWQIAQLAWNSTPFSEE